MKNEPSTFDIIDKSINDWEYWREHGSFPKEKFETNNYKSEIPVSCKSIWRVSEILKDRK